MLQQALYRPRRSTGTSARAAIRPTSGNPFLVQWQARQLLGAWHAGTAGPGRCWRLRRAGRCRQQPHGGAAPLWCCRSGRSWWQRRRIICWQRRTFLASEPHRPGARLRLCGRLPYAAGGRWAAAGRLAGPGAGSDCARLPFRGSLLLPRAPVGAAAGGGGAADRAEPGARGDEHDRRYQVFYRRRTDRHRRGWYRRR